MIYQEWHKKIILASGGKIEEDIFVTKPGIMITKISKITTEAKKFFKDLNIEENEDNLMHAEFNSRLTYLSFLNEKQKSNLNEDMIKKYQHLSVYNDEYITFLIAGVSIETIMEFVAHNEATVARLTSSKTKSQFEPLYRLITFKTNEKLINLQKEIILENIEKRKKYINKYGKDFFNNKLNNEIFNLTNIGNKVGSFTITMNLKNWHKTLIGRLSNTGVETEMLEIMENIAIILKNKYPLLINTVEEYYSMNNGKKYE